MKETKERHSNVKNKRPSYVVAETSKEQKDVLDVLTDLGYRWTKKLKANEHIPIEYSERLVVIEIYPNSHLLTSATRLVIKIGKYNPTELKIQDFKPKVLL